MAKFVKIQDDPNLMRDLSSGAIVNTDDSQYRQILLGRLQAKQTEDVCHKMKHLEDELTEIKTLLKQFINGRQDG